MTLDYGDPSGPLCGSMTQTAWADLLADRDQPGDAQRARALAGTALPVARARGDGYIEHDPRSVLERIDSGPNQAFPTLEATVDRPFRPRCLIGAVTAVEPVVVTTAPNPRVPRPRHAGLQPAQVTVNWVTMPSR